jgi:hypothetical protein
VDQIHYRCAQNASDREIFAETFASMSSEIVDSRDGIG